MVVKMTRDILATILHCHQSKFKHCAWFFSLFSGWRSGRRGCIFHFIGTRITQRCGVDWTILPSYCRLGYRLIDAKKPAHAFYNDLDKTNYDLCTEILPSSSSHLYSPPPIYVDDPETFKDAPICIQVIGKILEEEAVVAMGDIVDSALKIWVALSKLWLSRLAMFNAE